MSHTTVIEEAVHFGEGGRLSGILTFPAASFPERQPLPWFVLFNAGLLHRVGPNRLYVRLARQLAQSGFGSFRFDQSGKGESPLRPGLSRTVSVAMDYQEIMRSLEARLGRPVTLVLGGLCAGADDAIRLAPKDSRAVGLILLDPVCFPDAGFAARAAVMTYGRAARYLTWLKRRLNGQVRPATDGSEIDPMQFRGAPSLEELRSAFAAIGERRGRALSVFTEYALRYYNQPGQLARVVDVDGPDGFNTEVLWPEAEHIYPLEVHRRRLIDLVTTWAEGFRQPAQRGGDYNGIMRQEPTAAKA